MSKNKKEFPCKNCITKVMCKNMLEKELKERKTIPSMNNPFTFNIHASIRYSVRKKCCIIDRICKESMDNRVFYHTAKDLLDIFNIKSEEISYRIERLINEFDRKNSV